MKALITGITGMIGSHFAKACRAKGWDTVGIARNSASSRLAAIGDPSVLGCDILGYHELEDVFIRVARSGDVLAEVE